MYNVYPFTGFKLDWTSTAKPIPKCGCNEIGTDKENCASKTDKCKCKPNYTGEKCESGSSATFAFNKTNVLFTAFLIFLSQQY